MEILEQTETVYTVGGRKYYTKEEAIKASFKLSLEKLLEANYHMSPCSSKFMQVYEFSEMLGSILKNPNGVKEFCIILKDYLTTKGDVESLNTLSKIFTNETNN